MYHAFIPSHNICILCHSIPVLFCSYSIILLCHNLGVSFCLYIYFLLHCPNPFRSSFFSFIFFFVLSFYSFSLYSYFIPFEYIMLILYCYILWSFLISFILCYSVLVNTFPIQNIDKCGPILSAHLDSNLCINFFFFVIVQSKVFIYLYKEKWM